MDKYQCLKLISCQVSSPNCQKITWGHHGGHLMPPMMPPMLFFSKNKNYLSNQMHSFFPRTKITWGGIMCPHDAPPPSWGHQTLPTLHPPPRTSLTSTPHTPSTHPPHPVGNEHRSSSATKTKPSPFQDHQTLPREMFLKS